MVIPKSQAGAEAPIWDGPAADKIADLSADLRIHSVRLWLAHNSRSQNPGFSLSHDLLSKVLRLRCALEIDIYRV